MAVPDPLTLNVDLLPPPLPATWLDGSLPLASPLVPAEAVRLAKEIISYHEDQFARHGRWKRSVRTSRAAFALLAHHEGSALPHEARGAVAHALGVAPSLSARDRGDKLAQGLGYQRAMGLTPTVPDQARRRRVSVRTVQQLLRYPVVAKRVDATERFYLDPINRHELDPRALARRFREAVPHPRDTLPDDAALRVIAGMRGSGAVRQTARWVCYHLLTQPGAPLYRPALLAAAYALGLTQFRKARAAGW